MKTMRTAKTAASTAALAFWLMTAAALAQRPSPPARPENAPPSSDQNACLTELVPKDDSKLETRGQGGDTLSEKLSKSDGVICPPRGVDSEITLPPAGGGLTPIIPAPGTPGGDPTVRPK